MSPKLRELIKVYAHLSWEFAEVSLLPHVSVLSYAICGNLIIRTRIFPDMYQVSLLQNAAIHMSFRGLKSLVHIIETLGRRCSLYISPIMPSNCSRYPEGDFLFYSRNQACGNLVYDLNNVSVCWCKVLSYTVDKLS